MVKNGTLASPAMERANLLVGGWMTEAGLTVREDWKFSIVDAALIPREYLIPDEKKIGRIVRAMKDATNIPGVRVYAEKGIATRTLQD